MSFLFCEDQKGPDFANVGLRQGYPQQSDRDQRKRGHCPVVVGSRISLARKVDCVVCFVLTMRHFRLLVAHLC